MKNDSHRCGAARDNNDNNLNVTSSCLATTHPRTCIIRSSPTLTSINELYIYIYICGWVVSLSIAPFCDILFLVFLCLCTGWNCSRGNKRSGVQAFVVLRPRLSFVPLCLCQGTKPVESEKVSRSACKPSTCFTSPLACVALHASSTLSSRCPEELAMTIFAMSWESCLNCNLSQNGYGEKES